MNMDERSRESVDFETAPVWLYLVNAPTRKFSVEEKKAILKAQDEWAAENFAIEEGQKEDMKE